MPASARFAARIFAFGLTVLVLVAGSAAADVIINEFEHTGTGIDFVEVFNTRADTSYTLTGWYLENDLGNTHALAGVLGPNGYLTFPASNIVTDGGQIELYDSTINLQDVVAYGTGGGAPLPPSVGAYTCSRAPDGIDTGDHAADWNLDETGTFSAANDGPSSGLGIVSVFINEAGRGGMPRGLPGTCPSMELVEIFNDRATPLVLSGWRLIDGLDVTMLTGSIPPGGYLVINDFAPNACFQQSRLLYLFNPLGQRVDQLGFAGNPLPPGNANSYQRLPDGALPVGPYNGFDYNSSGGGESLFVVPQTFGDTNQTDVAAPEEVNEISTWGRIKSNYR